MYVPTAVIVLALIMLLGAAGLILLLICGVTNRFIGFSLAFEAIAEDYGKCKAEVKELRKQLIIARSNNDDTDAIIDALEDRLREAEKQHAQAQHEIGRHKKQKQYLTRQYVQMSNEYAWFRTLIRDADQEKCGRAEAMVKLKKSCGGFTTDNTEVGGDNQ